ncbi:MAG: YecR family lipoprotein [Pseudomonadota bacterium]
MSKALFDQRQIALFLIFVSPNGCATQVVPIASGVDEDGRIEMSYERPWFSTPSFDYRDMESSAIERCQSLVYDSGRDTYEWIETCLHDTVIGCRKIRVAYQFQCAVDAHSY